MATEQQRAWAYDGEQRGWSTRSKLTALQRDEIRRRVAEGERPQDLAKEFGITASYVRAL